MELSVSSRPLYSSTFTTDFNFEDISPSLDKNIVMPVSDWQASVTRTRWCNEHSMVILTRKWQLYILGCTCKWTQTPFVIFLRVSNKHVPGNILNIRLFYFGVFQTIMYTQTSQCQIVLFWGYTQSQAVLSTMRLEMYVKSESFIF